MILPDANLLIYAINVEASLHREAKQWVEHVLSGPQTVAISWSTVLAFVRLTTSRSMCRTPLPIEVALNTVETWLAHPAVALVHPGPKHFSILRDLLMAVGTGGNLTSDAHLAALAIEHGAELCSFDNDFARFPRLNWSNPLEGNTLKL